MVDLRKGHVTAGNEGQGRGMQVDRCRARSNGIDRAPQSSHEGVRVDRVEVGAVRNDAVAVRNGGKAGEGIEVSEDEIVQELVGEQLRVRGERRWVRGIVVSASQEKFHWCNRRCHVRPKVLVKVEACRVPAVVIPPARESRADEGVKLRDGGGLAYGVGWGEGPLDPRPAAKKFD